ncbi:MAG: DUF92 domain-containing protein [Spirochaetales bacterium]|nr:DUF92 domain-containing protein [Spirochaetales bacterium]
MTLLDSYMATIDPVVRFSVYAISMLVLALLTYRAKQLTLSGAIGAFFMGFGSLWCGGFTALSLYLFFLISAALIGKHSKRVRGINNIQKKGGTRDISQVFANGGPALMAIILYYLTQEHIFLVVFSASLAEAVADTWAGEIGVLSERPPVSIITFRPMQRGLSGAVSFLGTISGLLAAVLYALFYKSLYSGTLSLALVVALTGFAGCLVDSFLGATVQAHYLDEEGNLTEKEKNEKGEVRALERGIRFFDNDMVNFTSNLFSFLFAWGLSLIFV